MRGRESENDKEEGTVCLVLKKELKIFKDIKIILLCPNIQGGGGVQAWKMSTVELILTEFAHWAA